MTEIPNHVQEILSRLHPEATFYLKNGLLAAEHLTTRYLYKQANAASAAQLRGESLSLKMLNEAIPDMTPKIVSDGVIDGQYYMLTEWHELKALPSTKQAELGRQLAKLHQYSFDGVTAFGFQCPTFCGATKQLNEWNESWSEFFSRQRVNDLLERIGDSDLCQLGERLGSEVIPVLLDPLDVRPSLLHGDLWSGNVGLSEQTGKPLMFDPSSYFGHSEADLGITRMFGGFSQAFYDAYHEIVPKTSPSHHYEARIMLYELYHHLNHVESLLRQYEEGKLTLICLLKTLLFGGSYKQGAKRIIESLVQMKLA